MNSTITAALPHGGPLKIDVRVAQLFLAQLQIMCAPLSEQREKDAIEQRKLALQSLDEAQRRHAKAVCSILLRLLDQPRAGKRAA